MRKVHLIMMFVLLTFVGQTFASVILPCFMPMTTSNIAADKGNGSACHETNMQMNMMAESNDNISDDCCDQTCHCPVGSCLSVALTMAMPTLKSEVSLFNATTMFTSAIMPQHRSSLYRPPIFV
ncbi:hypothetical protein [Shewanella sp. OMA3-2]|uniref:hypothetical protein n=1 Tax=Shewanella sp. OMA3-2 TaxID=2908650 RepID=UPI001F24C978|nr:hypothetical protein [Shewanella sp. OMA3-2]UJF20880.1 hypothetical protein L0B17_11955 [Shewanella sp. OMA3-2]